MLSMIGTSVVLCISVGSSVEGNASAFSSVNVNILPALIYMAVSTHEPIDFKASAVDLLPAVVSINASKSPFSIIKSSVTLVLS